MKDETQLPLFEPESTWRPPAYLPDPSQWRVVALDCETRDENLDALGPGHLRGDGRLVGLAVHVVDAGAGEPFTGYLPIAHLEGGNLDRGIVAAWVAQLLAGRKTFVFASAQYDLGWIFHLSGKVPEKCEDVCLLAALLDEEDPGGYSLDSLGRRYLGRGKDERLLREAAAAYGVDPKSGLWKLPARLVGPYAEEDPRLTGDLWVELRKRLALEGLLDIAALECELTPDLYQMSRRGIRVDLDYGMQLNERWLAEEDALLKSLRMRREDIWTQEVIVRYCQDRKIQFPLTAKGNPSINKDFMEHNGHPDLIPLRKVRALNRTRATFLESVLLKGHIRGRIHPQYIQLARDEGGTRTGRLSCKNPNAQQFPKRSTLFDAKAIRKCLLPEEGELWAKFDYWSQEPTIQVHYGLIAGLPGAAEVAEQFRQKKKLYTIIERETNGACNYDQAKMVVLGRSYGMGVAKMAESLGLPLDECERVLNAFDSVVPYIKTLADNVGAKAKRTGFIRTIAGRHRHFDFWQPAGFGDHGPPVKGFEAAKERWPEKMLERAWTYKAFNALIQGSSADQTKTAMLQVRKALGLPLMQVHDELSKSVKDEKEALQMKEILENCVKLRCPAQTDMELGRCWG